MNSDKINRKVIARVRMQRYRASHRRIDYVPSPAALAAIERHLGAGLDCWLAGVIDQLITAGDKAITGNAQRQKG